jgi:DNA-binding transcriptional ArsR family regulator
MENDEMTDPLGSLVVDSANVDRGRLATCLQGRMGVDADSGHPVMLDDFRRLGTARAKILCYLLAKKAAVLLGKADVETAGPTEISRALGVPAGTVGRTLRELAEARLVVQDDHRQYLVASHQLLNAEAELGGA